MRERSLLELTTTLGAGLASDAALDAALRIVLRELRVERGAFFVLGEDGAPGAAGGAGVPAGSATRIRHRGAPRRHHGRGPGRRGSRPSRPRAAGHGRSPRTPDRHPRPGAPRRRAVVRGGGAGVFCGAWLRCAASPIENGLLYDELRRVHQKLSGKRFELHNLFDIGRDLAGSSAEEAIQEPHRHRRDGSLRRFALRSLPLRAARALSRPRREACGPRWRPRRFPPKTRARPWRV